MASEINPLSKKVRRILEFDLDKDTLNSLSNVSELVTENNLTTRRNLRANIEKQSLQINEKFISAFQDAFQNMQILSDQVNFIDQTCQTMMSKIEELKFQTSDFLKQTSEVNLELKKLDTNEKVLNQFVEEFQLTPNEIALISLNMDANHTIDDRFFNVLNKIQNIHAKAKASLANNQHITGFEIMDLMSKYEEMANDKLYRWTISILRTTNLDIIELQSHLFRSISHLQKKDVLFKHCLDEYTTVRRSAISHVFIEALTRGRTSNNTHYAAMERYSHDILRYIGDMLSFLHQTAVFEKDMLNSLLKFCDQEKLTKENTVKSVLSVITEGLTRPLKIRIENSLICNNKSLVKGNEKLNEKTKNYFLVKNIINFYLQTFGQLLADDSPFVYLIKELLILSDKVFYNSLNFYCSSNIVQRFDSTLPQVHVSSPKDSLGTGEYLGEYVQLIGDLLEIIKSSMSLNPHEQKLETHRILSAMIEPFLMQYVLLYSSKLSSIEMTIFSYNCAFTLCQTIVKYQFTQDFVQNLQKQLDEYVEVLVNEQFLQIMSTLSVTSFYNAIQQGDQFATPTSTFSGCDQIAVTTFLKLFDKFVGEPRSFQLLQIATIRDENTRVVIWNRTLTMVCQAYEIIYSALLDPKNNYTDIAHSITYKPDQMKMRLLQQQ